MLERMPSGRLDEIRAYDNVHGIGLDRIREIVTCGLARLITLSSADKTDTSEVMEQLDPWRATAP